MVGREEVTYSDQEVTELNNKKESFCISNGEKIDTNLGDIVPILILSKRISRFQDFMHYTLTLRVF